MGLKLSENSKPSVSVSKPAFSRNRERDQKIILKSSVADTGNNEGDEQQVNINKMPEIAPYRPLKLYSQ